MTIRKLFGGLVLGLAVAAGSGAARAEVSLLNVSSTVIDGPSPLARDPKSKSIQRINASASGTAGS